MDKQRGTIVFLCLLGAASLLLSLLLPQNPATRPFTLLVFMGAGISLGVALFLVYRLNKNME
ncbi:MAG: hypothetical protein HS099_00390 [Ardenticatenaceae bacterium]|nr:hypothetical protein [Ardenticatenaceae bacterium]